MNMAYEGGNAGMEFSRMRLSEDFSIDEIISLHFFEWAKGYMFEGERHPFWEFLYVDKGEVEVISEDINYVLRQGMIIFHKPNEFHNLWANNKVSPNLIVMAFDCTSPSMEFFENRIFTLGDTERQVLFSLLKEGMDAFLPPFDQPHTNTLQLRSGREFGSVQLVKIYLQLLLIDIRRKHAGMSAGDKLSNAFQARKEAGIVETIGRFFEVNIKKNVTVKDLCVYMNMSRSRLTAVFKESMGTGLIEYFRSMKTVRAKSLLRDGEFTVTEIAEMLGYSSMHNFSRDFKKATGVSPSQYAKTIRLRMLM
jgi:AraC-like DNA-binding protein